MAIFEYRAKDFKGTSMKGRLEAEDEEQVWWDLRASGLFPIKVKKVTRRARRHLLRAGRLAMMSRELFVMLSSGIPLVQAVGLLLGKEKDSGMKGIYSNLYEMLVTGSDFSAALDAQKGVFPPFFISMFRAGEMNGHVTESAGQLKAYYEREDRLRQKTETAMVYPLFLFFTMAGALILLFTKILPGFFDLFSRSEELPAGTRLLINISKGLTDGLPVTVLIGTAIVILAGWGMSRPAMKRIIDRVLLHLPVCGPLLRTICTARFARTFGFLYAEGVPVAHALEISADVLGNSYIKEKFHDVIESVCDGTPLSAALESIKELDRELLNSIYIGEETGHLSQLAKEMGEVYDREAEHAAERLTVLVEPVMIILMGIVICMIMLSVMVPIYQYYQNIG